MTYYYWDFDTDNVFLEEDGNGNVIAEYTHEPKLYGELIAQERDGQVRYYNVDGQESTRELTDENGDVTDTFTYTAFGEEVERTGTTVNPFRYKGAMGYYTNSDTNDIYVRTRPYQPRMGRWISSDPLGFIDGPNVYQYVFGNPVDYSDPSGSCCCCCVKNTGYTTKRFERPLPALSTIEWGVEFTHATVLEFINGNGDGLGCRIEWYECPDRGGSLGQKPNTWNPMHGTLQDKITNWDDYQEGKLPFDCPGGTLRLNWKDSPGLPFPLSMTVKFAIRTLNEPGCDCPRHNVIELFTLRLRAKPGQKLDPFLGKIQPGQYDYWELTPGVSGSEEPKKCGSHNVPESKAE